MQEMFDTAIDVLETQNANRSGPGILLLIENELPDEAGHENVKNQLPETEALDSIAGSVIEYAAETTNRTTVAFTGDHESGDLTIDSSTFDYSSGSGITFGSTSHTGVRVPLYTSGRGDRWLPSSPENTAIFDLLADGLGVGPNADTRPTASFTTSPDSPAPGDSVTFDASDSSDLGGSIATYEWDFGDGATATGETTTHTYSDAGDYTAELIVTDDAGTTATATETVSVGSTSTTIIENFEDNTLTDFDEAESPWQITSSSPAAIAGTYSAHHPEGQSSALLRDISNHSTTPQPGDTVYWDWIETNGNARYIWYEGMDSLSSSNGHYELEVSFSDDFVSLQHDFGDGTENELQRVTFAHTTGDRYRTTITDDGDTATNPTFDVTVENITQGTTPVSFSVQDPDGDARTGDGFGWYADFGTNIRVDELTVDSGGGGGGSTTIVDDFEDGDIDEYSGNTGSYTTTTSSPLEGSVSLECPSDFSDIGRTDVSTGTGYEYRALVNLASGAKQSVLVCSQSASSPRADAAELRVEDGNDRILIIDRVGGGNNTLDVASSTVSAGTTYEVGIAVRSGPTYQGTLYDTDGTELAQTAEISGSYSSGGVGWWTNTNGGKFDYLTEQSL
jgi:PKD repeat protein